MTSLWLIATEESNFGLNFNILETNLINLLIIWGVLFYFGSKFLGNTLSSRRSSIEESIQDAERRQKEALAALEEQNKNLAQAQVTAKEILDNAALNAAKLRDSLLAETQADIAKMQAAAVQDVSFQQEKVVRELRQRIADLAIARAEAELPNRLNPDLQTALIDKSIALLGD